MSEITKLMQMGISNPQTRYIEMKEAQKTGECKTIAFCGNTEKVKAKVKGIRFDENGEMVTGVSFSQVPSMIPPKDKKFGGNQFVRGKKMIEYKREYNKHLEDVANGRKRYNRCLEYVGECTPVGLIPKPKREKKITPVTVSDVPTVHKVREVEYSLDGKVNYFRKSPKYTRYATRTIDKENDWEQMTLDQTYENVEEVSIVSWLDNVHMNYMDKAPIEQHQAVLLGKATWVTEIFDDSAYNRRYPQVEVKKVGQMKLELF